MYTELVNIISSYKKLYQLASELEFGFEDSLEIREQLRSIDRGIDLFTAILQKDCRLSTRTDLLRLQLALAELGLSMKEKVIY